MICTISKGKKKRKREGGEVSALPVLGGVQAVILQDLIMGRISGGAVYWQIQDWSLHFQLADCLLQWDPANPLSLLHTLPLPFCAPNIFSCVSQHCFSNCFTHKSPWPPKPHPARCPPRALTATSSPKAFPAGPSKHTLNSFTSAQPLSRAGFSTERSPREVHGAPELGLNQAALTTGVSPSPQVASPSARAKSISPNSLSPGSDGLS